jgi:Predicted nucleotide-binding protein containing TIR-like domain
MVLVNASELVEARREALQNRMNRHLDQATAQSKGFASKLLNTVSTRQPRGFSNPLSLSGRMYGGYAELALLGFAISDGQVNPEQEEAFLQGVSRLAQNDGSRRDDFLTDDVAILGVAAGLATPRLTVRANGVSEFLVFGADQTPSTSWTRRLRQLAGDLLDPRRRLQTLPSEDTDSMALECSLKAVWPDAFVNTSTILPQVQEDLLHKLLTDKMPEGGELDRLAVWLKAIDVLLKNLTRSLKPEPPIRSSRKPDAVLIMHGKGCLHLAAMMQFIRSLGLVPQDLDDFRMRLSGTVTVWEVIEFALEEAQVILVLVTPEEQVMMVGQSVWRPDFDLMIQVGAALMKDRQRAIVVCIGDVKLGAHLEGFVPDQLGNNPVLRSRLRERLKAAGCPINDDSHYLEVERSGNFDV